MDRGKRSLECISLLLCLKLKYPEHVYLLRGNHEAAELNATYGFYDEVVRRCGAKTYKAFSDCFDTLPVCAVAANRIFCVHGGISPHLTSPKDVNRVV